MVFAGFVSEGKTTDAPILAAPTLSPAPGTITRTSFYIVIQDVNASESAIEIEYSSGGSTNSLILGPGSDINQPLNNLTPKTMYSVRVRALGCPSPSGCSDVSPWSNIIYMSTLIDLPPAVNLKLSNNCPSVVGLEIDANNRPEDIEYFIFQRSFDNSSFENFSNHPSNTRSFYDGDARPGRNIFYRIVSVNSSGVKPSNTIMVPVKPYVAPADPINVISNPSLKTDKSLTITWDNPSEDFACGTNVRSAYFLMVKRPNESIYTIYSQLDRNASSATITGLKMKETIDYRIFSTSTQGIQSSWIGGRDLTSGPPNTPTGLIGVAFNDVLNNSSMMLSWKDESNDEDYFVLEYSKDSVNFNVLGKIKFDNTNLKHSNLEEGIKYFYRVKAGNYLGESSYSPISSGIIHPFSQIPKAPYGLKGKIAGNSISLNWYDDSNSEKGFILEKSTSDTTKFELLKKLEMNTITFSDNSIVSGKKYLYRIKAFNDLGESSYSNTIEVDFKSTSGFLQSSIRVFPNPTFDYFEINIPSELKGNTHEISIYSNNNKLIQKFHSKDSKILIDLKGQDSGNYIVNIKNTEYSLTRRINKY